MTQTPNNQQVKSTTKTPFIQVKNITKRFYGVKVLKDVSVSIYPGEVLGVIGENGAGKSTLMKIICGSYSFEEGEAYLNGEKIQITSPSMMRALGINMVYQDTKLVPELKVYQNIYLHNEILTKSGLTDDDAMRKNCKGLLEKFGIDIDVNDYIKDLTIAQMQLVEIAKALLQNTKMLILDEPTSSLTPREVNKLFEIVNDIKKEGTAVVFISHRISELLQICDRFVVLRDGCLTGEVAAEEANEENLSQIMVGREITKQFDHLEDPKSGRVILSVKNLSNEKDYSDVSFNLHEGEILGFYGIEGNGQREMLRTICGLMGDYTGSIQLNGTEVKTNSPRQVIDSGISFITNDRHGENVFMPLSIGNNITIPNLKKWSNLGFVKQKEAQEKIETGVDQFNVKCYGEGQLLRELSGGNQQKVAIAAKYLQEPKVLIFDECTRGVDVGAKSEIYQFLRELASQGIGVIILSSDMTEIISVSDRILVMASGRILDEMNAVDATEDRIISSAVKIIPSNKDSVADGESEVTANKVLNKIPLASRFRISKKWAPPIIILFLTMIMMIIGAQKNPTFLTPYNIGLIMWQVVPLALVVIGQAIVIITGGMDISVGNLTSLTTCVLSYTLVADGNIVLGIISALAVGVAAGLFNGFIIVKMKVPHFVATLATQIMFTGFALVLRDMAGGKIHPSFISAVKYKINGTWPIAFIAVVLLVIIAEIIMQRTKGGVYIYATGSNNESAFYSGINVNRMRILSFVISSVMASVAALVLAARIGCGDPVAGDGFSFMSITSVLVGGVVLSGGRGTIVGAVSGAVLLTVLMNILNMIQVSTYWQYVCMGVIIVFSVAMYYLVDHAGKAHKKA
jgi:ribose transport system ATP-binding protein